MTTVYFGTVDSAGNTNFTTPDDSTGWFWRCDTNGSFVCPGSGPKRLVELSTNVGIFSGTPKILLSLYDSLGNLVCQGAAVVTVGAAHAWQGHLTTADLTPAGGSPGGVVTLVGGQSYRIGVARDAGGVLDTYSSGNILTLGDVDYDPTTDLTGGWPSTIPAGTDYDGYLTSVRAGVVDISSSRPIRMPSISDRVARGMALGVMAVHTVVGRHELRGAAKRTKVALPILTEVRIKPVPVRSGVLPYTWKGAAIKKPRPFPDVALTRKPLPITKSTVLPHMLKGAPARKPFTLPEAAAVRTPAPVARPFVGKRAIPPAAAAPRVVVDPTVTAVRIPLPRTRSVAGRFVARVRTIIDPIVNAVRTPAPIARSSVGRAAIPHPVTGSGAPIASMIEMDHPVTRTAIVRRTVLPPPAPTPSRARAIVNFARILRPVTDTTVGSPQPKVVVATPATSRARAILALVRMPRIATDTTIGTPRPRVAPPAAARPRPRVMLVRIPLPRIFSHAGSGRPSPAVIYLAIARSDGKITLSLSTSATTLVQQNSATTPLGAANAASTSLAWQNVATTPLNTSE